MTNIIEVERLSESELYSVLGCLSRFGNGRTQVLLWTNPRPIMITQI